MEMQQYAVINTVLCIVELQMSLSTIGNTGLHVKRQIRLSGCNQIWIPQQI